VSGKGRAPLEAAWRRLEREIVACRRCPRLVAHCREVAATKRRAYLGETYWGRPVPGFGDPRARILLLGLAPGAHGSNRTGRMFTGDRSGEWLYGALHRHGLASQATATARDDGLVLRDVFVSAACRCAPPDNKPAPGELARCARWLDRELALLDRLRVVVALGKIAWDAALKSARRAAPEALPRPLPVFGHGTEAHVVLRPSSAPVSLLGSYHPSQQNTSTGRLTVPMWDRTFARARALARR
jgi:uracil-DNA glycosylase family 4